MIIHSKETVHILNNSSMYNLYSKYLASVLIKNFIKLFGTKALLCQANLINSIIQEHKCKKHLSYETIFFLNFIYNFHTRLGKGKVLFKAFWEFQGLLAQI